jgi:hypothetical protein
VTISYLSSRAEGHKQKKKPEEIGREENIKPDI